MQYVLNNDGGEFTPTQRYTPDNENSIIRIDSLTYQRAISPFNTIATAVYKNLTVSIKLSITHLASWILTSMDGGNHLSYNQVIRLFTCTLSVKNIMQ